MNTNDSQSSSHAEDRAPLRILYVASTRHAGGLEVASVRLAELLVQAQQKTHQIIYACRPEAFIESQCQQCQIPTVGFSVRNSGDLAGVGKLIKIIADHSIDIVHVHSRRDYVTAVLAKALLESDKSRPSPPLILHCHLLRSLGSPKHLSGYLFAPFVDRVLAVSEAVRLHVLKAHSQLRPEQVVVVPNSVDVERFRPMPDARRTYRQRHGFADSDIVVGMVGRLDTKGQNNAIRAIGELRNPNVKLLLVGSEGKVGYINTLHRLARERHISDQVQLIGAQKDVPELLNAMDIFLHLPIDEAFGLALAEAMSCELPVLATKVGGCVELVQDGVTGMLTSPFDIKEIASKLSKLIESATLRAKLGCAGRDFVRNNFTTQHQLSALGAVYRSVSSNQIVKQELGVKQLRNSPTTAISDPGELCEALQKLR